MYEGTYQHEGHVDAFDCDPTHDPAELDRLVAYHRAMSQAEQSFARILAGMAALDGGQRDDAEKDPSVREWITID
jgi:hypothetical protein